MARLSDGARGLRGGSRRYSPLPVSSVAVDHGSNEKKHDAVARGGPRQGRGPGRRGQTASPDGEGDAQAGAQVIQGGKEGRQTSEKKARSGPGGIFDPPVQGSRHDADTCEARLEINSP